MEEQNSHPQNPLDQLSKTRKYAMMFGLLLFVTIGMLTVVNMGFSPLHGTSNAGFMSDSTMWIVNISLGILGGAIFGPYKILISSFIGGITGSIITGLTLLYISYRENLYSIEFIIPVVVGMLIGLFIFSLLLGKPKEKNH